MKRRTWPPRWVDRALSQLSRCVQPIDPMGDVGYIIDEDDEPRTWTLKIFPLLNELYGGPDDGKRFPPGFSMCLSRLSQMFDLPPHIDWVTPTHFTGEFDGPHISASGMYRGVNLLVLIYDQPPSLDAVALRINTITGAIEELEESDVDVDESAGTD